MEENNILERGQHPLDTKLIAQYSRLSMGSPSRTVTPAYCAAINENVRRYERRTKTAMSPTRVEYQPKVATQKSIHSTKRIQSGSPSRYSG